MARAIFRIINGCIGHPGGFSRIGSATIDRITFCRLQIVSAPAWYRVGRSVYVALCELIGRIDLPGELRLRLMAVREPLEQQLVATATIGRRS